MMKTKKKNLTCGIPHDLVIEILLRLPVRSLLRFKCVCKSWCSLISDSEFANSHYDLAATPTHRLLLRSTHFYIESVDLDASLHDDSGVAYVPLPLPSPPSPRRRQFCLDRSPENHELLGSCRGFVLLYYENGDLIIWNPSTSVSKRLSHSCSELTYDYIYGFVYDAALDDFLVVLIELYDAETYGYNCPTRVKFISFKSDSWNFVGDFSVRYKDIGYEFRAGSILNGALHWLVFCDDKKLPVIIAYDLVERTLSEIALPHYLTVETIELYGLRILGECLTVCCTVRGRAMDEIWMMKEYKVESSWTKSIVLCTSDILHNHFSPLYVANDGGIFGSNTCGRLEKVNGRGEVLEHLIMYRTKGWYGGNLQSAMYRESLLSIPSAVRQNKLDGLL